MLKIISDLNFKHDFQTVKIYKRECERIEEKLRKIKAKNILDIFVEQEKKYKELILNLKEATGSGNYTNPETWTVEQINDYVKFRNKQIQIKDSKNGRY